MTLITVRLSLFKANETGVGTIAMGFCSEGERLGSALNPTRKNENL